MSTDENIQLLLDLETEVARWRRRTMFLVSVVLHGILVLIILFTPDLLRRGKSLVGIPVEPAPQKQYSYLWIPPEVLRRLRQEEAPPKTNTLSDQNRRAQGHSPLIDPYGVHNPYSRGNTKLPEIAGGAPPAPPPAAAPAPMPGGSPASPSPQPPAPAPQEKKEDGLRLEDVKPDSAGSGSRVKLPAMTPGQAIQQSLQAAARGGYRGGGAGAGDSSMQFENLHPNFSTEAPLILSDTQGVDFGPYLSRVVYIVRRNWYAVIPESARLGERGRVGIVFEILKNGEVPQMRLVASSGSDPLDRAAIAGIRASIPFPPLPQEFTGKHLVLQFIFLYNLGAGY
ncbi:MAG: TonB C-terminal domain-containing protein [Acidobacteriia bacterium]|nr:TonB C-terminal domain-containing protein [Terriglobia bacterium]